MPLKTIDKSMTFREVDISYRATCFVCPKCSLELVSLEHAGEIQKIIADAYRKEVGLLTGEEIKEYRKKFGLTQEALANEMTVGIASIKRWEGGIIQSKAMDKALHNAFWDRKRKDDFTGCRDFSIPRVKLVLKHLEEKLKLKLLKKGDKFLYAAKYLWYSDMIAHRELNKSMTGATYAALPLGPQLNNYRDLIDEIKQSDENEAEHLTVEEMNILNRIAKTFPEEAMIFDASHREIIWKNKSTGQIIPYSESSELSEM